MPDCIAMPHIFDFNAKKKRCKVYYKPKEDDPLYAKDLGKKPTFKSPSLLRQPNDNQIFLCHL